MFFVGQILFTPRLALALSACLLVGACGQRGDLYLPDSAAARERTRLPGLIRLPASDDPHTAPKRAPAASAPASSPSTAAPDTATLSPTPALPASSTR